MFDFDKSLSKAKVAIMMKPDTAFISSVLMALKFKWDENHSTAYTDGLSIGIAPKFWEPLSPKQRIFLLLHETWHVALFHVTRCKESNKFEPKKWNYACDYYINLMLVKEGHEFIEGGLLDYAYDGMSVEEIYDSLPDNLPNNCLDGDIKDPGSASDDDNEPDHQDVKAQITETLARAMMQAQMAGQAGSIPDNIRRAVDAIRNPKLPWNVVLEQYMSERIQDEYSWNKRNRRFSHIYLPGLDSEGMGEIRCYVDASGSVSQKELSLEVNEMCYIKEVSNPTLMTLRAFACTLGKVQQFERDQDIDFDVDVGGGTSFEPIYDDLMNNPETEVAVIFTDGYLNVPDTSALPCDLVWVIVNNPSWTTNTGRVIHMEIKQGD